MFSKQKLIILILFGPTIQYLVKLHSRINNFRSRSYDNLLLWNKLRSQSYEIASHVHTQLLQLLKIGSLLFILHLLKFNLHFNLHVHVHEKLKVHHTSIIWENGLNSIKMQQNYNDPSIKSLKSLRMWIFKIL